MTKLKTEFLKPIKQDSDTSPPNNVGVGDSSDFDSDDSSDLCSQTSSVSDAWGPATSTTPLKDSYPISSEDDDDEPTQPATSSEPIQQVVPNEDPNTSLLFPESLWKNFLSWCRFESSPASSSVYSGEISSDAFGPFDIKKVRYDVTTGAPLWKLIGRVFSLRNYSKGPNEKIVHYLLGEKLLEILAYQILVYCHLTGSFSDIWVCRAVQVLIQQGEESPAALRCLAYLVSMGIDILDIVRQGNTLVGLGTDIHVKSSDPIDAPGEQILHCTSNSSYIPL